MCLIWAIHAEHQLAVSHPVLYKYTARKGLSVTNKGEDLVCQDVTHSFTVRMH